MNSNDYSEACLNSLLDIDFNHVDKIDDLLSKELINDFEASNRKQGSRTPHFYGLPKIHREYITFPPLRPICSGFNSCTAKFSESLTLTLSLLPRVLHPTSRTHRTLLEELNQMSPPQLSHQNLSWPLWMSHPFILTLIMKRE